MDKQKSVVFPITGLMENLELPAMGNIDKFSTSFHYGRSNSDIIM